MSPHTLGNFNFYSLLQQSFAHSLNVVSCPWQFQFTFSAPAATRTFLECCLLPSAISIFILHSLNVASCPRQFQFMFYISCPQQFQFIFPTPAVDHTFLECSFMPLAIPIYIPHSGGQSYIS